MRNTIISFTNVFQTICQTALRYGMLSDTIGQLLHVKHKSLIADHNVIKALDNVSFDVKKARLWGLLAQMARVKVLS